MINFLLHIFVIICNRFFLVLGYNLILGKTKLLYFGHVGYMLLVGYTVWGSITQLGIHYVVAILMGVVLGLVGVFVLTKLAMRLTEDAFGVMSIAIHLVLLAVVLNWQSVTRGALGVPGIQRQLLPESMVGFALVIGIVGLLWCVFIWWIDRSSLGRQMEALSEHPWYAQSLGVQKKTVYFLLFTIAGFGVVLNVIFWTPYIHFLSHNDYLFPTTVLYITMIVAGKPGSFWGCIVSIITLSLLAEGLRFVALPPDLIGPVRLMLFGILLFVAVWLRRDTLFPHQRKI